LAIAPAARAQSQSADVPQLEPAIRRWLDVQTLTIYSRYRFVENSKDVTTSDQLQYKDAIRARVNFDAEKRYSVTLGYFSGGSFTSSWNNLGVGNDTTFVGSDHYLKQLYASATPVKGLELQYGGLFVNRGEGDEWLTYDDDGFLVGGRVSLRRPKMFYLDEITVTHGAIGPQSTPSLNDRWDLLGHSNYTQVLGVKRVRDLIAGSVEYDRQIGADIIRAAATLHFSARAPVSTIRYQQYWRLNQSSAAGFGLWAERPIAKGVRVQGGYVTVDQFYGGWNADRMQSGRRFFANATIPIYGPLAASFYATQALSATYAVPIHQRFDVVVSYDVLSSLRRLGLF
jgi:hypothetical protein